MSKENEVNLRDGIQNLDQLEFVVFCIESLAKQLGADPRRVYSALSEGDVIDGYIAPTYEALHTQSREYILEDIIGFMKIKGVEI